MHSAASAHITDFFTPRVPRLACPTVHSTLLDEPALPHVRVSISTTPIIPFQACHTSALFIYFYFLPVIVLPTLVSKFFGAATTVFTVETDVLATFLVVFITELPM